MYPVVEEWKTYHHLRRSLKSAGGGGGEPESNCQFTENGGQSNNLNDTDRTIMNKTYTVGNYVTNHLDSQKNRLQRKGQRGRSRGEASRVKSLTVINALQCVDLNGS